MCVGCARPRETKASNTATGFNGFFTADADANGDVAAATAEVVADDIIQDKEKGIKNPNKIKT